MLVSKSSIAGRVFGLLVFMQMAIVVTGGAVRITGSGLGCPTWPECTPGSYTPVPNQAEGQVHAWIEFGNRLLTFVLLICALSALVIAIRVSKNSVTKNRVRLLAALQLIGILGQGVLGGITVLTDLHPIPVAGHFLLSIFLIAGAISLRYEVVGIIKQKADGIVATLMPVLIWLTLFVLVAGTIVTGSGPHAGDENAKRFGFSPRVVSWLHADLVIALVVLSLVLWLITRVSQNKVIHRYLSIFLLISLSQGLIGYVQYFTGLPEILVATHLLGATMVWASGWSLIKVSQSGFKMKGLAQ
ncbi:MAG: COX15/CtaA family protein [Actinobacteria bacterium]|nr:COX15/CtaA family protein [Actinomycetota bacterium]